MSIAESGRGRWLQPPQLRTVERPGEERRATWLELFFDLVFVVAVAQLANSFSKDVSVEGFLIFCGLFVPVWWAWVGYTVYADRFDTDDVLYRVLMLAGMFAAGALASAVPGAAAGTGSRGFAIAYVVVRAIMLVLYARAWRAAPPARPLVTAYLAGFATAASLWLLSLAVPTPWRYAVWAVALAIDLGTPLASWRNIRRVPVHASHIPERIGLFTLIVLGETVLAVVLGTEAVSWSLDAGLVAALGFTIGASFWWLYFDYVDSALMRRSLLYVYAHLPLVAGLTAVGVGVKLAIKETGAAELSDGARWILCAGIALAFGAVAVLHLATTHARRDRDIWLRGGTVALALVLAVAGGGLGPIVVVGALALALAGQVVAEVLEQTGLTSGHSV